MLNKKRSSLLRVGSIFGLSNKSSESGQKESSPGEKSLKKEKRQTIILPSQPKRSDKTPHKTPPPVTVHGATLKKGAMRRKPPPIEEKEDIESAKFDAPSNGLHDSQLPVQNESKSDKNIEKELHSANDETRDEVKVTNDSQEKVHDSNDETRDQVKVTNESGFTNEPRGDSEDEFQDLPNLKVSSTSKTVLDHSEIPEYDTQEKHLPQDSKKVSSSSSEISLPSGPLDTPSMLASLQLQTNFSSDESLNFLPTSARSPNSNSPSTKSNKSPGRLNDLIETLENEIGDHQNPSPATYSSQDPYAPLHVEKSPSLEGKSLNSFGSPLLNSARVINLHSIVSGESLNPPEIPFVSQSGSSDEFYDTMPGLGISSPPKVSQSNKSSEIEFNEPIDRVTSSLSDSSEGYPSPHEEPIYDPQYDAKSDPQYDTQSQSDPYNPYQQSESSHHDTEEKSSSSLGQLSFDAKPNYPITEHLYGAKLSAEEYNPSISDRLCETKLSDEEVSSHEPIFHTKLSSEDFNTISPEDFTPASPCDPSVAREFDIYDTDHVPASARPTMKVVNASDSEPETPPVATYESYDRRHEPAVAPIARGPERLLRPKRRAPPPEISGGTSRQSRSLSVTQEEQDLFSLGEQSDDKEGYGQPSNYVTALRKKAGTCYSAKPLSPKCFPVGIRPSSSKKERISSSIFNGLASRKSGVLSSAEIKHGNLKPRLLASEIDEDDSTEFSQRQPTSASNQLKKLNTVNDMDVLDDKPISFARNSSMKSNFTYKPPSDGLKLFVANPDSDSD